MDNESKANMSDVTVTGEIEIQSDPNGVKENVLCELDDVNDSGMETTPSPVSYTHLDVYKRQLKSFFNIMQ